MKKVLLLSLLTLVLSVFGPINNALAQIPRVISYQAELLDENGKPLNQTVAMTFAIYEQQNGGTSVWTEPQDVAVVNGFINVYLGSVTPLDLNFNKPYWLEVQVGTNPAFPRTRLAAVPYALNTLRAVSADSANIAGTVVDSAITQSKLAAGVQALPWGQASGDLQGTYPNPTLREGVVIENIKPGSITLDKLSPGITLPPGGQASGDLTGNYPDPLIAPGAVKTDRIFNGAVTTEKIADASIINSKIDANAVTTDKIMNGTILVEDLNATSFANWDKDSTNDIIIGTTAGGDLKGTYPNPTVKGIQGLNVDVPTVNGTVLTYNDTTKTYNWVLPVDSVVTGLPIVGNGTVASPITLNTNGVSESDILFFDGSNWNYGQVQTASIADGAVTSEKILDGEVQASDIASSAVITDKINDLAVTTAKIADLAVTTGKINDLAVTTGKINDLAITTGKIADGAVTNIKIVDKAVTTEKISSDNEPLGSVLMSDGNGSAFWSNDLFTYPLTLGGDVTIIGNLSVNGNSDFSTLSATTATIQDLNVVNDLNVAHDVIVTNNLSVDGTADLATLSATTATIQDLTVANTATFADLSANNITASGNITADGDVSANNVNVTTNLIVDGTSDLSDLSASTATIADLGVTSTLNAADVNVTGTLNGASATFTGTVDAEDVVATTALFADGAQSMAAPVNGEDLTNKAYVDNAISTATDGDALITAINAATGTINAARLPLNIVYTDANNAFTGANTVDGSFAPGTGTITANAIAAGSYGIDITGTATTATNLVGTGSLTGAVDLATAEVNGILPAGNLPANVVYTDANNTFTGTNTFAALDIQGNISNSTGNVTVNDDIDINGTAAVGTDLNVTGDASIGGPNGLLINNGTTTLILGGTDGISITTGDVVLAYEANGTGVISDNVSVYEFTGAINTGVTMPTNGVAGKILYISATGAGDLTGTPGANVVAGTTGTFVYVSTGWVRIQ